MPIKNRSINGLLGYLLSHERSIVLVKMPEHQCCRIRYLWYGVEAISASPALVEEIILVFKGFFVCGPATSVCFRCRSAISYLKMLSCSSQFASNFGRQTVRKPLIDPISASIAGTRTALTATFSVTYQIGMQTTPPASVSALEDHTVAAEFFSHGFAQFRMKNQP